MKIKEIYFDRVGPYEGWKFSPHEKGLHLFYGPNESGKTTFLNGMRSLLFGFSTQEKKEGAKGHLAFLREEKEYYLERQGKKIQFYPLGESLLKEEPNKLWWHGLDRKTYERIFALTVEDMQGLSILDHAEVRTRFFGTEEGENVARMVQDMEKASSEFLVTSTNGRRKIHVLVEQLEKQKATIASLMKQEEEYVNLNQLLEGLEVTEREQRESLRQWEEYHESIELVLRAWETYQRMEEAKLQMSKLSERGLEDQTTFQTLDQEINQARDMMRVWRGREEALLPSQFSPDAPIGQYATEIERLHEEVARWEQLEKEVVAGESYLDGRKKQLSLVRKLQVHWRDDLELPREVDWAQGERLSSALRAARSAYQAWEGREPVVEDAEGHAVNPPKLLSVEELEAQGKQTEELRTLFLNNQKTQKELLYLQNSSTKEWAYQAIAALCAVVTVVLYWFAKADLSSGWITGMALSFVTGAGAYGIGRWKVSNEEERKKALISQLKDQEGQMAALSGSLGVAMPRSEEEVQEAFKEYEKQREKFYGYDRELVKWHAVTGQHQSWTEEGKGLFRHLLEAETAWKEWRPEALSGASTEVDYFAMQQEYDRYQEEEGEFRRQCKLVEERREELNDIQKRARTLWQALGAEAEPSTTDLRRLYQQLQQYRQHQVRWEQKESQRKSYRDEYDQWHRKEKDLLLRQEEIVQKNGFSSSTEFRQQMISEGQYRQWETIFKQSRIQLDLLASTPDAKDLLFRRLREGKRGKWESEAAHSEEQIRSIERQLAALYERRGTMLEALRVLGTEVAMGKALQEAANLEAELEQSLEDWATYVLMGYFVEKAQEVYEEGKVPIVWERAAIFTERLTNGAYTLQKGASGELAVAVSHTGERIPETLWSSGLGDQIYLALRLSLAIYFSDQVEALPIVLDDALLRFDEGRQKAALELLQEVGMEHQVWLLTCQESLFTMAKSLTSDEESSGKELHLYQFVGKHQLEEWTA